MKYSLPVMCRCGEMFSVNCSGTQFPQSVECPNCDATIWLVQPLGNMVGMAILRRAATELHNEDWTLAIVLGAMAVECDLAYLFMKWNRIEIMSARMPNDVDEGSWEKEWRDMRTVAARLDKVSGVLVGQPFDAFLIENGDLLEGLYKRYPAF